MDTNLRSVKVALAGLTDSELHALIDVTSEVPRVAPDLLAWIDAACDWELNRRAGRDYVLQPPEEAISPEEDAIDAVLAMRAVFTRDERAKHSSVPALFDAMVTVFKDIARKR